MKILGTFIPNAETFIFNSLEEAEKKTRVSVGHILKCMRDGTKWRMWTFGEAADD